MRLFCIWNGAYKPHLIFAESIDDALHRAFLAKHLKRVRHYRKFADLTEQIHEHEDAERLAELAAEARAGSLAKDAEGRWVFRD